MEEKNSILISNIIKHINDDELKTLCDRYSINTDNFYRSLSKGIYKNNLKKRITQAAGNKDVINRAQYVKNFVPLLSDETNNKIFPGYKDYIKHREERKQRKLNNEIHAIQEVENEKVKEIEDNYEKAYADYYNVNSSLVKDTVESIKEERRRLQDEEEERRKQQTDAFYNKLIKERNDELDYMNMNKIDNSPFTDKINSVKATVERQLRKLRELEQQEREWKNEQEEAAKIETDYENAYIDYFMFPSEEQTFKQSFNELSFMPAIKEYSRLPITTAEKRIHEAYNQPFNTVINLDNLTDDDKQEMGELLKQFYEKHIKTAELNSKI